MVVEESVLGMLDPVKRPFTFTPYWAVFITQQRIIVARSETLGQGLVRGVGMGVGGGVVGGLGGRLLFGRGGRRIGALIGSTAGTLAGMQSNMNLQSQRAQQLKLMKPNDILAQDKQNFSIPYSSISEVDMIKRAILSVTKVKTKDGKEYKFVLMPNSLAGFLSSQKPQFEQYVDLLKQVLGSKLKTIER